MKDPNEWEPNPMPYKEAIEHFSGLSGKYCDLVWYARKPPLEDNIAWDKLTQDPDIRKGAMASTFKVEEQYPEETKRIACPEHGDWEHGFNSGMLAALRYVLDTLEGDHEFAKDCFPMLDT